MRKSLMITSLTALALATNALGQAAMETLMTHSISTAVGTHVGTALGNATNALANRTANQTSTSMRTGAVQHASVSAARRGNSQKANLPGSSAAPANNGSGSLIASIQGGEKASGCAANANQATANGSQAAGQNCDSAPGAGSHPSVVNLPAPK